MKLEAICREPIVPDEDAVTAGAVDGAATGTPNDWASGFATGAATGLPSDGASDFRPGAATGTSIERASGFATGAATGLPNERASNFAPGAATGTPGDGVATGAATGVAPSALSVSRMPLEVHPAKNVDEIRSTEIRILMLCPWSVV